MIKALLGIFKGLWTFAKWPVYIALAIVLLFSILTALWIGYFYIFKGYRFKKGEHYKIKPPNIIKRIFWDAPRRYAKDIIERDPETFRHQGIVIFTGKQGKGKTVGAVQFTRCMQQEYPKAKCLSNLKYKYADGELKSWDDIIDYKNPEGDKKGVIILNDEIQNSFNSKESKNFPMEYMGIVTQNRKNRRIIVATAQNFYMLSKDIRSQCTEIRKCTTLCGCLTIIHRLEPEINNDGEVEKLKSRGWYFFVHDQELRECYDTYEVIKGFRKTGFLPRSEQKNAFTDFKNNDIYLDKKGLKKVK